MDKIIELTTNLKKELDQLPLFIDYKKAKSSYDDNEEIKELKKQIVRAKNENRLDDQKALLNELHSHPLYVNYMELESEVRDYLQEVSKILNKK